MKWNEMSVFHKIIYVVGSLCSVVSIVLCILDISGKCEVESSYVLLLLAANSLCSGINNWKRKKGVALSSVACAAFIFIAGLLSNR